MNARDGSALPLLHECLEDLSPAAVSLEGAPGLLHLATPLPDLLVKLCTVVVQMSQLLLCLGKLRLL